MYCGGVHHTLMSCSSDIHVWAGKSMADLVRKKPKSLAWLNTDWFWVKRWSVSFASEIWLLVVVSRLPWLKTAWPMPQALGPIYRLDGSRSEDYQWVPKLWQENVFEGWKVNGASFGEQHTAFLVTETSSKLIHLWIVNIYFCFVCTHVNLTHWLAVLVNKVWERMITTRHITFCCSMTAATQTHMLIAIP